MHSHALVLLCAATSVILLGCLGTGVDAMPPPQCSGYVEDVPPRIRKVCAALSTIYELSNAMEAYLGDTGSAVYNSQGQLNQIMDTGVKRQDVDHVFLRFGRRR